MVIEFLILRGLDWPHLSVTILVLITFYTGYDDMINEMINRERIKLDEFYT